MQYIQSNIYIKDIEQTIKDTVNIHKLMNKSIFLTGASGLIGSFLTDTIMYANKYKNFGTHIYVVGRNRKRLEERFESWLDSEFFHILEQDVREKIVCDITVDYIIHAASNSYPAAFQKDPVGTIEGNVIGTKNLLDFGRRQSIEKFLYLSSGEVYGQLTGIDAFREDMQGYVNPSLARSCYPMGKRMAENLCIAYKEQYDSPALIARPCHVYGANVTEQDNRATAQFLAKAAAGENIVLKSKGEQIRSYMYVADCVSGILTILLEGNVGETYNIANSDAKISIAGFAQETAKIAGTEVVFADNDSVENPMRYAVLDASRLEELGWHGSYTIDKGIKSALEILKNI